MEQLVPKEVCDLIWLGFLGMRGKFEPDELFILWNLCKMWKANSANILKTETRCQHDGQTYPHAVHGIIDWSALRSYHKGRFVSPHAAIYMVLVRLQRGPWTERVSGHGVWPSCSGFHLEIIDFVRPPGAAAPGGYKSYRLHTNRLPLPRESRTCRSSNSQTRQNKHENKHAPQ